MVYIGTTRRFSALGIFETDEQQGTREGAGAPVGGLPETTNKSTRPRSPYGKMEAWFCWFISSRMKSPHWRAMASATWGNVLLRYLPRLARTNSRGFGYSISGINGGSPLSQYRVFLVYFTPNQLGWMKQSGRGSPARAIGIGFSTATKSALALRQLRKNSAASCIFRNRSWFKTPCCIMRTELTLQRYVHGGWAIIRCQLCTLFASPAYVTNEVSPTKRGVTSS